MKKFQLVKISNDDMEGKYILVESTEVEKVIGFYDDSSTCRIEKELSEKELEDLQNWYVDKLDNEELEDMQVYEFVNEFFEEKNIDNHASDIDEVEEYRDQDVLYLNNGVQQCNLNDYEYEYSYSYWDGSNWKRLWLEEIDEDLSFNEGDISWTSLDNWDGRNWSFGGNACHAEVGKWGEKYLIKDWSQYQGTHTYITILEDREELEDWLKQNGVEETPEGI